MAALNPWILLALAILSEVCGTLSLKASNGMTAWLPTTAVIVLYGLSFWLLSLCVRSMELGIAYAVWAGVGTALITGASYLVFGERLSGLQILCIGLIVIAVIGLHAGQRSTV